MRLLPTALQERGGLLARGLGANVTALLVTLLVQVATVPIFIDSVGVEAYGYWVLLTAVPMYLSLSDLGFSGAAATRATSELAKGKVEAACAVLCTAWLTVSMVSVIGVAIIMGIATYFLPTELYASLGGNLPVIVALLIIWVLLLMQIGFCEAAYRCAGLYHRGLNQMSISRLFETAALGGALYAFHDLLSAAVAVTASRALALLLIYRRTRREVPWFRLSPQQFDWRFARELLAPSLTYAGFPFGMAAVNQGMVLLVGSSLGSVWLVAFTTTRTMCNVVLQLSNVVTQGSLPELTRSLAEGDTSSARKIFRLSVGLGASVCGIASLLIAIFGSPVVHFWTGGSVIAPALFVALMAATTAADFPWQVYTNILRAQNLHQRVGVAYMLTCVAALVLAAATVGTIGLVAVPISLFAIDFVVIPLSIFEVRRVAGFLRK